MTDAVELMSFLFNGRFIDKLFLTFSNSDSVNFKLIGISCEFVVCLSKELYDFPLLVILSSIWPNKQNVFCSHFDLANGVFKLLNIFGVFKPSQNVPGMVAFTKFS